jgi:hypothetical protein
LLNRAFRLTHLGGMVGYSPFPGVRPENDVVSMPQNLKRRRYFGRYRSDKWQREPR